MSHPPTTSTKSFTSVHPPKAVVPASLLYRTIPYPAVPPFGQSMQSTERALEGLLSTYHELNNAFVPRVPGPPTPLDFLQHVRRNQPVVFTGVMEGWGALEQWNDRYLREKMEGCNIDVAITPLGNADSIVSVDGVEHFVKPYTSSESFSSFMDYLRSRHMDASSTPPSTIKYAQSQDGNLSKEFTVLASDLPSSLAFADSALSHTPDAVNVWIGNSDSTSALHKDNYENLYCQVLGKKNFILLSPLEGICVREKTFPVASYDDQGKVVVEEGQSVNCWPSVDPDVGDSGKWWGKARPISVELHRGEVLYLPALWYHKVFQEEGDEGICCAVNYWYDMDFEGPFYSMVQFVRDCAKDCESLEGGNEQEKHIPR